jgi:hypothetical protein
VSNAHIAEGSHPDSALENEPEDSATIPGHQAAQITQEVRTDAPVAAEELAPQAQEPAPEPARRPMPAVVQRSSAAAALRSNSDPTAERTGARPKRRSWWDPQLVPARQSTSRPQATGRQAPDRIRLHGRFAASDAIVGLDLGEDALWDAIEERLAPSLGRRWQSVAALLRPLFDSGAIKPVLSALSRGSEWKAPILAAGREIGEVALDARALGDSFAHDGRDAVSVEFETGTESQAGTGAFREGLWRSTVGLYLKGDAPTDTYRGTFGGYQESVNLAQVDGAGRAVARTKTVEPGVSFTGQVEIGLRTRFGKNTDFEHEEGEAGWPTVPRRHTVDVGVTVSVPWAETRDADGRLPEVTEHYAPPARIARFQRFGATDTIWDLHLMPREVSLPAGFRALPETVAEWIREITPAGAQVFGKDWPAIARQIAGQVQPGSVHQRLKEMGSGQPITVQSLPAGAEVDVTARVIRMEHVRGTPQTEFATGTDAGQRTLNQATTTNASTVPVPGQNLGQAPHSVDLSGTGTVSVGRDQVRARADNSRAGMQTKVKGRGEVFDGTVQLRFSMRYRPQLTAPFRKPREAVAIALTGVRAVIERGETTSVARHDETIWDAGQTDPTAAPATETDLRSSLGAAATTTAEAEGLPLPPNEIWSRGLPDPTVVLDLWGMERLREEFRDHLSELTGSGNWAEIESTVLAAFDQRALLANLAVMTRDVPLRAADLPHRLRGNFELTATAVVQALTFDRRVRNAELAPQRDVGSQLTRQRLNWRITQTQEQVGGRFGAGGDQAVLPTYGRQNRHRTGWRLGSGGQAVSNAKFNVPLVYFKGLVRLLFRGSYAGRAVEFDVTLPFEVGLPAGLTLTLSPPGLRAWTESGRPVPAVTGDYGQLAVEAARHIVPGDGYLVAKPKSPARFAVPERVADGRLGRSDFLLSLGDDSNQLATRVATVLEQLVGGGPGRRVSDQLDIAVITAQVPGLTAGDVITVPVSGNGWSGHVLVSAVVGPMTYRESVPKVEFENGGEHFSSQGLSVEERRRTTLGLQYRGKFPHLSTSVIGTHNTDVFESMSADAGSRAISRDKTVETGALLEGEIEFNVDYRLRRFGVWEFNPPADARQVVVSATVMVPERDMRIAAVTGPDAESSTREFQPQRPDNWFALPERIRRRLGLSAADIVLDVWPAGQSARRSYTMADTLRDAGLDDAGREVFARSWPGMRDRILAEVDLRRLHFELKAMMANHSITVDGPRGTPGRALITARLASAHQVSATAQTEFNVGTGLVRDRSEADPRVAVAKSQSDSLSVQVLGNSDPTGLLGVQGGVTFVGILGRNDLQSHGSRVSTAMTTKVKAPGVVYEGAVKLEIRLESRPALGAPRVRLHEDAQVNVRFLAEQDDSVPAANEHATEFAGEPLRERETVVPVVPREPPSRVWGLTRGQGLRDTDTVRGLPDTGGLLQALDAEGRALFGAQAWRTFAPVARGALAHPALMAGLPAMTRGQAMLNTVAVKEIGRSVVEITAEARIVSLQYRRTAAKAEMNSVNEVSAQSSRSEQFWSDNGPQFQVGPSIGPVTIAGVLGLAYRRRTATVTNSTGRVMGNAKIPAPSAIYDAYVATTLTLRRGTEQRVISGVIPAEIGIPVAETTPGVLGVTEFRPPVLQAEPEESEESAEPEESADVAAPSERTPTTEDRQAEMLLGAGHRFSSDQLARVFGLIEPLRQRTGPQDAPIAEYLRWLGRAVGLHHQDPLLSRWTRWATGGVGMRRLFELLDAASEVFGDEPVTLAGLADLRRLGDLTTVQPVDGRLRRRRPLTTDRLRARFRRELGLLRGVEVTAADLRELTARMRGAKSARRTAGGGRVRSADLRAQIEKMQEVREAVARARRHLSGDLLVTVGEQRKLLRTLAVADAGGTHLGEVMDLLDAAADDQLAAYFDDDGGMRALLDMAFVGTGDLGERYRDFLRRKFRRVLNWRDLAGPDELLRLTTPDGALDRRAASSLATKIADGFRRPYDGARLSPDVTLTLTAPAAAVTALRISSQVAGLLEHTVQLQYEGVSGSVVKICPS